MSKKNPDATARLPLEHAPNYAAMVTTCNGQVGTIQQCPDYANQPAVQSATSNVINSAKTLDQTLTDLNNARALVLSLENKRDQDAATLRRDHDVMEASINVASAGKAQSVLAWGAQIATHSPIAPSTNPPVNVRIVYARLSGNVVAKCKADPAAYTYFFQMGTSPANPDAWPAPVMEGKADHTFTGLTPGQKVYARVAVVRRGTGQSPWSNIAEIIVR